MDASNQPVSDFRKKLEEIQASDRPNVDFANTELAFAYKSDAELSQSKRLFSLMQYPKLVDISSGLGAFAVKHGLPFAESITLATIYKQFVGGRTLLEVESVAKKIEKFGVMSILDYGAEGKNDEQAYNLTMTECIRAIEFAGQHQYIPIVSTKISGLTSNKLLIALSAGQALDAQLEAEHRALMKRMDSLCHVATENKVQLYIDAEESWMQEAIDQVVVTCMRRYNRQRAVVVNTYQLYRHDRYEMLKRHFDLCRSHNVILGAKLVRGAYMDKERERAKEMGYPSPINPDKASTDREFNKAVRFCLEHIEHIDFVNASHNQESARIMVETMYQLNIAKNHPQPFFAQLYGMSDNLTFNLAAAGYRVGKYLPYGPVKDVVPYLVRRAQENTSITGEVGRELKLIKQEVSRRASRKRA